MRPTAAVMPVIVLLSFSAFADELVPAKFTKQPTVVKVGDKWTIGFAVDRETDVAVFVEGAGGKAVRHLVAGRPGKNGRRSWRSLTHTRTSRATQPTRSACWKNSTRGC